MARIWLAIGLALAACKDKPPPPKAAPSASAPPPASASAAPLASAPASSRSVERDEAPATGDAGGLAPGELNDVGPAGPATASPRGVVMITKSDTVALARAGDTKKGGFSPVTAGADAFRPYARGPAVAGDHAYWVSGSRLVRRAIGRDGPLETLAEDARDGTRVAAVLVGHGGSARAAAAYIAQSESADVGTVARLWIERVGTWTLTPDGAAASSTAVALSGSKLVTTSLEGRTGMTPVHARVADFSGSTPVLGEDVVVWVAGPAQPLTEIAAIASESVLWAFVPLERDVSRFGLAQIRLGEAPRMGAPVTWRGYPNGLDPAPIASATACGSALVLYAVPAEAKPRAPQELRLAQIGASGLGPGTVVARSRAFTNVSLSEHAGGVLIAYAADHRTWATTVHCPSRAVGDRSSVR